MTLSKILEKFDDIAIGYVKIIEVHDTIGTEKLLISYSCSDLAGLMGKTCDAYYKIGEYLYVVM